MTTSVTISSGKDQRSVPSMNPLDFVGEHQSRLQGLRPVVLLLACTCHGTIWTESIADPVRTVSFCIHVVFKFRHKQNILRILEEIRGPLLGMSPST